MRLRFMIIGLFVAAVAAGNVARQGGKTAPRQIPLARPGERTPIEFQSNGKIMDNLSAYLNWTPERVTNAIAQEGRGDLVPTEGIRGPLQVHPTNPRYFTDDGVRAVYLTGSHVWNNLQDMGFGKPPPAFDFEAYLDFLQRYQHNFIRLWRWEEVTWDLKSAAVEWTDKSGVHTVAPHPWARTGPDKALDGKPKFNLDKLDPAYFERLRLRVQAAGRRGMYVSVMLFEGWELQHIQGGWKSHPFHADNNTNGIDGDADGDGRGIETHTLKIPAVTHLQEAYIRQVIEAVGDLDNVLFEISNETGTYSTEWQYHMIRFIKKYEKTKPKQHPVGMTFQYSSDTKQRGTNKLLFDSPADWISPNPDAPEGYDYRTNPPPAVGEKVILSDTDHLWGIGGNADWAWKSFLRGHNPLFMDPYDNRVLGKGSPDQWNPLRQSLGHTRRLAEHVDLVRMTPSLDIASTAYCLANPGSEYLAYQPGSGKFTVNLENIAGTFTVEWFGDRTDLATPRHEVKGGSVREFVPPMIGPAVLYLKAKSPGGR
jgi:Family of unknown function (DUF6298)